MTAAKPRHLHAVPSDPDEAELLRRAAAVLAERHATFAYQRQHAQAASQAPDFVADRNVLITKTLYRLKQPGADPHAVLAAFADAMFVHGHMDATAEDRPGLTDATLATIIKIEDIEKRIRQEAPTCS